MAIFNQPSAPKRDNIPAPPEPPKPVAEPAFQRAPDAVVDHGFNAAPQSTRAAPVERNEGKESLIASDLTIEGKIEGAGHIRIAGRFKGDVHVQGDLTIEVGARLNGGVRARKVVIAGELEGNIESAQRVELLESGVMIGDLKAETLIVSAGSRMKGQVEFGAGDKGTSSKSSNGNGDAGASS
ncbi:bactofilin family protein [Lysobacter fragariae]